MSNSEKGKRKQIYLPPDASALLEQLARQYHDGNASAVVTAALDAYVAQQVEREARIRAAVLDLATAQEPDERYDPADDDRAETPHLLLAALLDEQAARAIGSALNALWLRWQMPGGERGTEAVAVWDGNEVL